MSKKPKPLEDVRVLDLTIMLAGPFCTMLLADYGAEVIKIEMPGGGDPTRAIGPFVEKDKDRILGGYFFSINRNKKSLTLNLKTEKGKEIFKELVKKSDVLVENFRPGVLERLGLGYYDVLRKINPRLVYATITGFGHPNILKSPYWDRPSFDLIAQAMGGVMSITGPKGGPPLKTGPGIGDTWASLLTAFAIMAALHYARRTGIGQHVDCSMYDAMLNCIERAIVIYSISGEVSVPMGNAHPLLAPYDAYKAKDGYVVIAAHWPKMWENLCKVIGREDLVNDPRFLTTNERAKNYDQLKPIIEEWTSQRTRKEIIDILLKNDIPAGPINTVKDIFECPHVKAREMLVEVQHPLNDKVKIVNAPVKMSETPGGVERPAPLPGEHNEEILCGLLGYSKSDVEKLKQEGVI